MIVPRYWAESRIQAKSKRRRITIRRFGWSDDGPEAAQAHADLRAREALEQVLAGAPLKRSEPKRSYNGAEGVPIREEIIRRVGEVVVTRNVYGALCLNTPNVMFVDVDFKEASTFRLGLAAFLVVGLAIAVLANLRGLGWASGIPLAVVGGAVAASVLSRLARAIRPNPENLFLRRLTRFSDEHPSWGLRVYRTPAGFRVLVTHATFDPEDPEVEECFRGLGVDPLYERMCRNQKCFRARVSPKPWRVGIARPAGKGVWPLSEDRLAARQRWVADYERACEGFASCAFELSLGSGIVRREVADVQRLHDELARAEIRLPLA